MIALLLSAASGAQPSGANYDESKVPRYTLPDPLVLQDGAPVRDAATWQQKRRPEILHLFETNVYGHSPARPPHMTFELSSIDAHALGGKAIRKEVTVYVTGRKDGPKLNVVLYLPAASSKPVPVFLGLNFTGNHTVNADPGIRLGEIWLRDRERKAFTRQRGTEQSRGSAASRWQVEKILARGYGLATIYYGDIEPDFDGGLPYSVRKEFSGDWGAIGAWAWGLSRALDYLETDHAVDAKRVAVMGHSRLGKAALWAGAQDTRFALVVSNDSGEGGAAISRRNFGERIADLNTRFPWWFTPAYRQFDGREEALPVDQHMLLALIAPRPLYVASAAEDLWADPHGEFLSAVGAGPVYRLLGKQGLGTDRMPSVGQPIQHTVAYHVRAGKHDVTEYDWEQYLTFADQHLRSR